MEEKPLIWTTKGNLPEDSLRHEISWVTSDEEISLIERYFLGDEEVKKNVHVLKLRGISTESEAGGLN